MGYIQTLVITCIIVLNLSSEIASTTTTKSTGEPPRLRENDPTLESIKVKEGSKLKLRCRVLGSPRPYTVWYKNGERLKTRDNDGLKVNRASLLIYQPREEDSGQYSCHRENQFGEAWKNYTLIVKNEKPVVDKNVDCEKVGPPQFKDKGELNEWIARPSQASVDFKCSVCGSPEPNITWYVDGRQINSAVSGGKYKVKRKISLVVEGLTKKDAKEYTCVAQNEHGSINHTFELKVIDFHHVSGNCPANWDHHSQSCYLFVFRYTLEWIDAQSYCKMLGATLVEVNSATEDHFLRQRFRQLSHSTANIWLGGSDILSEGSWVWVGSGEAFSYTGWHSTEPNNYHGGEHCAMMMYNNNQNWADTNCADRNCFICETSASNVVHQVLG